jgi:predicted nuclease of restriction endonuclease-like (RecB) superfamily
MEIAIPQSLLNNLDVVIKYQNMQLIREICKWKNWDAEEMIQTLIIDEHNKNNSKKIKLNLTQSCLNLKSQASREEPEQPKKNENVEIRVRKPFVIDNIEYMIESPHNNLYKDNEYIGQWDVDDNMINYDAPEF